LAQSMVYPQLSAHGVVQKIPRIEIQKQQGQ
jgi:hypothetical protein